MTTTATTEPEVDPRSALTDYQAGQLLYVHFMGDFKYRTDAKTRVPTRQWQAMIRALIQGGFVLWQGNNYTLTDRGRRYMDAYHLEIPTLS